MRTQWRDMARYGAILAFAGGACGDNTPGDPDAAIWPDAFTAEARCVAQLTHSCPDPAPGGPDPCAATLLVRFECDGATQTHDWATLGLIVAPDDGEPRQWDTRYACNAALAPLVTAVPCTAAITFAGAVADHPVTGADLECTAPPSPACR